MERLSSSVCLHNRLVSFAKKSLAEYLTHVFKFFRYLKNFSSKSEIYFKWLERIVESSLHQRLRPLFSSKSYGPRNSQLFDFVTVFEILTCNHKFETPVQSKELGCVKLP